MKLQIHPSIVYRVPQFSLEASLMDKWDELKDSIREASPSFFELIKNLSYQELTQAEFSLQHTVWKYFNRSRFRSTPYGSFAGLGTCRTGKSPNDEIMIGKQRMHRFEDWTSKESIVYDMETLMARNSNVISNSSCYACAGNVRYIFLEDGKYQLSEQPLEPIIKAILDACIQPISIIQLLRRFEGQDVKNIIEDLLYDQLLLCDLWPNIIGNDYFERIGFQKNSTSTSYIIAERPLISGSLNEEIFHHLPSLTKYLHQLLPSYDSPELQEFTGKFLKKFGDREVPLCEALDPELGVGYAGLDDAKLTSDLVRNLHDNKNQKSEEETPTLNRLLPHLLSGNKEKINLENIKLPESNNERPLPNTIPFLCIEADGQLEVVHIGGATSNSLLGRFTVSHPDIHEMARDLAWIEQNANPEILFFDIAYQATGRVDNVNRRKEIYPYHLSILNFEENGDHLRLSDLMVSVRNNKAILRSKQHSKRLIPRFASAYNYLLSSLSTFRFLCDLQHQETHKNLYLRLIDRLPGLDYYPQIHFRNIILSPESWRIKKEGILNIELRQRLLLPGSPPLPYIMSFPVMTLRWTSTILRNRRSFVPVITLLKSRYMEQFFPFTSIVSSSWSTKRGS